MGVGAKWGGLRKVGWAAQSGVGCTKWGGLRKVEVGGVKWSRQREVEVGGAKWSRRHKEEVGGVKFVKWGWVYSTATVNEMLTRVAL